MQYTLTCGGATAIVDTKGAELISYKAADGVERVWCGNPTYWAMHAPVLFPVVGALKDGKIGIAGTKYEMNKHGFARTSEYQATEIGEASATFTLTPNDETRAQYPCEFALIITHAITADSFTTTYKVVNNGSEEMYFCIGGHSGFSCPMHESEKFSDYSLVFGTPVSQKHPSITNPLTLMEAGLTLPLDWDGVTLPLDYHQFDRDAFIFENIEARSLSLVNATTGEGVAYTFNGFEHLGIWTPPGKNAPFLCIEPWHGLPTAVTESGNIEDKPNVTRLAAGEDYTASYTASVIAAK